ncbi:hypothetical protein CEP51_016802, partial [Fusarium floridanum]
MNGESVDELNRQRDMRNRENVALANLRIRTSADIFEAAERDEEEQAGDLASVLGALDEEFAEKERLSYGQEWCAPVPHERKVKTGRDFYKAFHETRT